MKAIGKIETISTTEVTGNENQYSKRTVLVDCTFEQMGQVFKNHLEFTFEQDNTKKLDAFAVGDRVCIDYAPQGRKYPKAEPGEGGEVVEVIKHFQYLKAWDIAKEPA